MLGDVNKGYEVARFPGFWDDDKGKDAFFAIYPFLGFITIPLVVAALYMSPKITADIRDIVMLVTIPFALIMSVVSYFIVEMVMTGKRSPIIVYSNGIEHNGGRLERLRHRPDFIPKTSIESVEISDFTNTTPNGSHHFVVVKIRTREGREKFISARRAEKMRGFREAVANKLGVPVKDKNDVVQKTAALIDAPSYSVPEPVSEGLNFCDGCGEKIVKGASFCGRCGKKL